jgi:hypothetical protein
VTPHAGKRASDRTGTGPLRARLQQARIVVLGDLHGDAFALKSILREARLTDARGHWDGDDARLIQLGDCIDRGPDSEEVVAALQRLQAEAPPGAVLRLAGNHEMELMRGELGYCDNLRHPQRLAEALVLDARLGRLVAACAVGPWLCVHGGLRARLRARLELPAKAGPVRLAKRLNQLFQDAARTGDYSHAIFRASQESGIFWTYANELLASKGALEVPQIVGHTVADTAFVGDGRAVFLDQGISLAMRGRWSFLEMDDAGGPLRWSLRERGEWRRMVREGRPAREGMPARVEGQT